MNLPLWLDNLAAYSAQIAVLVAVAAALAAALRLRAPRPLLACWQGVLAAVLLLPLAQPWAHPVITAGTGAGTVVRIARAAAPPALHFPLRGAIAAAVAAGIAVRLVWLAAGLFRLALYRRKARPFAAVPTAIEEIRRLVGVRADIRISAEVESPVTFGLLRPAILLPAAVPASEAALKAVVCHELVHVRRRDWAFTVFEELVRAALWFHPAVWWLLARIQLAREQVVDREAVALLASREAYLEALLEVAGGIGRAWPCASISAHLKQRVALIVKEYAMTRVRLYLSLGTIAAAAIVAAVASAHAFPFAGEPVFQEAAPAPNQVRVGGNIQQAKLVNKVTPRYPPEAKQAGVQGLVRMSVLLATDGAVKGILSAAGPAELVPAATDAVRQWRYNQTLLNGKPVEVLTTVDVNFTLSDTPGTALKPLDSPMPAYPAGADGSPLHGQFQIQVAPDGKVTAVQPLAADPAMIAPAVAALKQWRWTPPPSESTVTVALDLEKPFPATVPPRGISRIQLDPAFAEKKIAYQPPASARQATVVFRAVVAADGTIREYQLESGPAALAPAAAAALKQYRYHPTYLNGEPVEVITTVSVPVAQSQ